MKRFISVLASLSLAAAPLTGSGGGTVRAEEVYTYSQNGYTMTLTVDENGEAHIISCEGSGTAVIIPEIIGEAYAVAHIDSGAFSELTEIAALIIPDSVKSIGSRAFQGCSSLNNVYIGSGTAEIGDYAFSSCASLENFSVSDENISFADYEGMLCSADGSRLICYAGDSSASLPDGVTEIGKAAFFGRTDITSVAFSDSIASIGDYAFAGCLSLEEAVIPGSVTALGKGSFLNCSSLTYAELGQGISVIPEECFSMCGNLKAVQLPETITALEERAFFCCPKLSGIYLPEMITSFGEDSIGTHYDILSGGNAPVYGFCIFGTKGSPAHEYALASGIDFIDLAAPPLGDVNNDGAVNAIDATLVLMEYSRVSLDFPSSFTQFQRIAGDYNRDSTINAIDATAILTFYAAGALK